MPAFVRSANALAFIGAFALLLLTACAGTPSAPPNQLTVAQARGEMPILWAASPRPAPLPPLPHSALLVPVEIDGISGKPLYMQFDLGHPSTVLYANKWAGIAARLAARGRADLAAGTTDPARVHNLQLRFGSLRVTAAEINLRQMAGKDIDWDSPATEVIGTVGADVIDGRSVALDFKANTITIAAQRRELVAAGTVFTPFSYTGRRILLPATVGGESKTLIYDSGSSAFALITDEASWRKFARSGAEALQFPIKSWGNTLTAHTVASDVNIGFAGAVLPIREVSRIEGASWLQEAGMRVFGIGGMVGNALFIGHRLIIDTARQEFAVE